MSSTSSKSIVNDFGSVSCNLLFGFVEGVDGGDGLVGYGASCRASTGFDRVGVWGWSSTSSKLSTFNTSS